MSVKFKFVGMTSVYNYGAFNKVYVSLWRSYTKKARESVLFSVIFACGELYCAAVLFRLRREILRCAR